MLSARSLIVSIGLIMVVALSLSVLGLTQEPDSDGAGRDTFGVRAHGYRGVLEVLHEVGVGGERRIAPPTDSLPTATTIALLAPVTHFVEREPAYLSRLVEWVKAGGRVVVAPPTLERQTKFERHRARKSKADGAPTLLGTLGLDSVQIRGEDASPTSEASDENEWSFPRGRQSRAQGPTDTHTCDWHAESGERLEIALPSGSPRTIDPGQATWRPLLQLEGAEEAEGILAASFGVGDGEVIVVADPDLFANAILLQSDNAIAAVRLLSPEGEPVVFDEHYHGLSVRGSPLYLLTIPGVAALTIGLLSATALWAWRTAIALGPPVFTPAKPRRDLREYVEAMSRLLLKGRDGRRYLLRELRQGTLEELGRQLGLSVLTPAPDRIAASLSRRELSRAKAFTSAMNDIDQRLAQSRRLTTTEAKQLMKRANSCL